MAIIVKYAVMRQAWQNPGSQCDEVAVILSDGSTSLEYHHPSYHWPYSERFVGAQTLGRLEMIELLTPKE